MSQEWFVQRLLSRTPTAAPQLGKGRVLLASVARSIDDRQYIDQINT
jgi:hypothetical protein